MFGIGRAQALNRRHCPPSATTLAGVLVLELAVSFSVEAILWQMQPVGMEPLLHLATLAVADDSF